MLQFRLTLLGWIISIAIIAIILKSSLVIHQTASYVSSRRASYIWDDESVIEERPFWPQFWRKIRNIPEPTTGADEICRSDDGGLVLMSIVVVIASLLLIIEFKKYYVLPVGEARSPTCQVNGIRSRLWLFGFRLVYYIIFVHFLIEFWIWAINPYREMYDYDPLWQYLGLDGPRSGLQRYWESLMYQPTPVLLLVLSVILLLMSHLRRYLERRGLRSSVSHSKLTK